MVSILKCPSCKSYGISQGCSCGDKRIAVHPPRYSPEDRYAKYRRQAKEQVAENSTN